MFYRFSSLLALALLLTSGIASQQIAAQGAAVPGSQETEPASPEATPQAPQEAPDAQSSARATMYTFLVAFDTAQQPGGTISLEQAAACLDLSEVPPGARRLEGPQKAVQLKDVLDRTRRVDFDNIPDDPNGPPYVFLESDAGSVVIAPNASGEWLFTKRTVAALPLLWQEARSRPIAEGVTEAPRTLALWLRSRIPTSWQKVVFLLEQWQWLGLLILLAVGYLLSRIVGAIFRRFFANFFAERLEGVNERAFQRATLPLGIVVMAIVWGLGIVPLDLPVGALRVLHQGIWFVGVASLVWLLYRLVDVVSAVLRHKAALTAGRFDDLLIPLVSKGMKVLVTVFGIVFVADNLEIEIGSLLAGLGLGGLAVALAAQDTVKNLFGSLTVVLDRPFQIGDAVDTSGVQGTVEEVGIRSTRIRTYENSLVTLPNASLISASVDNKGARVYRRWKSTLSLTYDTPPAKIDAFCEGIREIVRNNEHTRKEGYYIYMNDFGASSLDVLLYLFFETQVWETELAARHEICLQILQLADRMEVDFAFPTRTVVLQKNGVLRGDEVFQEDEGSESGEKEETLADAEA